MFNSNVRLLESIPSQNPCKSSSGWFFCVCVPWGENPDEGYELGMIIHWPEIRSFEDDVPYKLTMIPLSLRRAVAFFLNPRINTNCYELHEQTTQITHSSCSFDKHDTGIIISQSYLWAIFGIMTTNLDAPRRTRLKSGKCWKQNMIWYDMIWYISHIYIYIICVCACVCLFVCVCLHLL